MASEDGARVGEGRARVRHGPWRLAAFAAPGLPLAAMVMPAVVYLPDYYATELGVSLAVVAFAFTAVRAFDLVFDPALGFIMDKTRTRFGRFRPWFVAGAPIAMLAVWMLFMAQPGIGAGYILTWLIVAFVGQSMGQLGHMAWAAAAAGEYDERSRIYGWMQVLTMAGMITILAMPPLMKLLFGADHADGVRAMGWFVIALLPPTFLLALLAMPEPAPVRRADAERADWRSYLALLRRGSVLRLLAADIAWGTGPSLSGGLFFFFFAAHKGLDRGAAGLLLLVYFMGALAGAPIWPRLARRLGKHRAMMAAGVAYAVAQLSVLATPAGPVAGGVLIFLAGLPFSAGPILLRSMMADVGDEERLESGHDRTGLLFSLLVGSVKIGSTLAVGIGFKALDIASFDPGLGGGNSEAALVTLAVLFAGVPALLGLAAAWLISGHRLDSTAHAAIRARLDERDGAAAG